MQPTAKTILITGATDGIGLATAKLFLSDRHRLLLHGRNAKKLETVAASLAEFAPSITLYNADLSRLGEVKQLADRIVEQEETLDVLINNAGVFKTHDPLTADGLDARFVVNAIAPYLLTKKLLPLLSSTARVVNVSSAAQAPVDLAGMAGKFEYSDAMQAYAQSKLAMTQWSHALAAQSGKKGPVIISVNPGSMLGSKMVREGFGVPGGDLNIGANILYRAALSDEFARASGKYFDNDSGRFSIPHPDTVNPKRIQEVTQTIERLLVAFD